MDMYELSSPVPDSSDTPSQFKIMPLGLVHSQKGDFLVDGESYTSMLTDFKARRLEIPVDYEHQTLHDIQAPAAGWITGLSLKTDGIYANVRWTERAAEYLKNREYRYCSPVIQARSHDRKALKLHSVALTNKPAIDAMTPIVNKITPDAAEADTEEQQNTASLAALLGLPENASINEIYMAVSDVLSQSTAYKLEVDASRIEAQQKTAETAVTVALKQGKIAPYQRDWAFGYAMQSPDDFSLWLKDAPQVVPMGEVQYAGDVQVPTRAHTRVDELLGLTTEDIRRYPSQGGSHGV